MESGDVKFTFDVMGYSVFINIMIANLSDQISAPTLSWHYCVFMWRIYQVWIKHISNIH